MSDDREYLRVRPSAESLEHTAITPLIESLHKLTREHSGGRLSRLLAGPESPRFEFCAVSDGANAPVEFFYGVDGSLDTLQDRLESMYPETFDIERVTLNLASRLVTPIEYDQETFHSRLEQGQQLFESPDWDAHTKQRGQTRPQDGVSAPTKSGTDTPISAEPETPDDHVFECSDGTTPVADGPLADGSSPGGPTRTEHGTILARPPIEDLEPMGVRWHGVAERKRDWMTTLGNTTQSNAPEEDSEPPTPLATVIDHLVSADVPMVFQVLFESKPDWSATGNQREYDIKHGRDTLSGRVWDAIEPSTEARDLTAPEQERLTRLTEKNPKRTFTVNARAVCVPASEDDAPRRKIDTRLDALKSSFDALDGPFYGFEGHRLRASGLRSNTKKQYAQGALKRVLERDLITGRGHTRFDLTLNAAELAHLITVPSGETLSMEGRRGTTTTQESQNPLERPALDQLEDFHDKGGLAIGYALDETGTEESEPTYIPPSLLPTHYGRFGMTGAGKSKALINDMLSLYEHTDGPIILIDRKGDGLPENYMRAHASRFGVEDLEANVSHFSLPEMLPGFSFFDIRQALASGTDRVDAVQQTADYYEEILKLVVGTEKYERASVAPTLIRALIAALFDPEHGRDNGQYRASADYFGHRQLEHLLDQLWQAGPPNPHPEMAPQSSDVDTQRRLTRQLQLDPHAFNNVLGGISNRLAYISQDARLREIFNNTEQAFDFRDVLDENRVLIFDLGGLRSEPAKLLTGLILSNLEDALRAEAPRLTTKPEDYVVNLLIDEAASVVSADVMNRLLEQGRGFRLSVGLSMQFPEQLESEGGRRLYLNALNNIGTTLVGKISVDREIAEAMAHEEMQPRAFKDRIAALPRGEWIAQVPSPRFGESGPRPFSIAPLPIPPGHPESDQPLEGQKARAVERAIERIQTQTADRFGIAEPTPEPGETPEAIQEHLGIDTDALDYALAMLVRRMQLREGVRTANEPVPVEAVDHQLQTLFGDVDESPPTYQELGAVRERSQLLAVELETDDDQLVISLTEAGEDAITPDTGDVEAAGGPAHDDGVYAIERVLTTAGFDARVVTQDRTEQPDGWATHPESDARFAIEVETTTPENPIKILTNLRKAQDADAIPLFVVQLGKTETYWAERIEGILHPPFKHQMGRGEPPHLYTFDGALKIRRASTSEELAAVRPVVDDDDSRRTQWRVLGEDLEMLDGDGNTHIRIARDEEISEHAVPAVYTYDDTAREYVVTTTEERLTYDTKADFEAAWVTIKKPFVPEVELPVPEFTRDGYRILILRAEDDPLVYTGDGQTADFETLLTDLPQEIDRVPAESHSGDKGSYDWVDADEGELAHFAWTCLQSDSESMIPKDELYQAYTNYADHYGHSAVTKSWFSRKLGEHIEFETSRPRIDGERIGSYTGIALNTTGKEYLE